MSCPRCGSHDLWDDDLWWGCNRCDFMSNTVHNRLSKDDVFNAGTVHQWTGSGPPYPQYQAPRGGAQPGDRSDE